MGFKLGLCCSKGWIRGWGKAVVGAGDRVKAGKGLGAKVGVLARATARVRGGVGAGATSTASKETLECREFN